MPSIYTYQKKDKLKSRKQTQYLFSKGQSINQFPIKLIYTIEHHPEYSGLKAGVGAPTRTFRKAVLRNRVKRLLREGYRLEKPAFLSGIQLEGKVINLFFLYTDAVVLDQRLIQEKIKQLLIKLSEKINTSA